MFLLLTDPDNLITNRSNTKLFNITKVKQNMQKSIVIFVLKFSDY